MRTTLGLLQKFFYTTITQMSFLKRSETIICKIVEYKLEQAFSNTIRGDVQR